MRRTISATAVMLFGALQSGAQCQTFHGKLLPAGEYITQPALSELNRLLEAELIRRTARLSTAEKEGPRTEFYAELRAAARSDTLEYNTTAMVNSSVKGVFETSGFYVQRFPKVQLDVRPVPPRDYTVLINDEPCPATEKSEYLVRSGRISLIVTRESKTCRWSGQLAPGQVQIVPCRFDSTGE
jgi:hypothetical protein